MLVVFNQPIMIQQLTDGEHWEDFFSCRAYVNALYGSEYWAARAAGCEDTVVFTVRYCRKIAQVRATGFRILYRGDEYKIQNVDNPQMSNTYVKLKGVQHRGHHV